jgi:hypothetical protein
VKILITPWEINEAIAFWLMEKKQIEVSPYDIVQSKSPYRGDESDITDGEFGREFEWKGQKLDGQAPNDQGPGRPDAAPGPKASSSRRRAGDCF